MSSILPLAGKKILLGVCGGIAAYKSAELTRRLMDQGAEVRIVMTASAKQFITPLTMQAVSGHVIYDDLLDPQAEAGMGHIELAKWADLILIAPATANAIARLRSGMADELLTTLCLATPSPIAIAPAMNQQMYLAPATQDNLSVLAERGVFIWGPGQGIQACGDIGPGRLLEVPELVTCCCEFFAPKDRSLAGVNIVITAGPTQEAIDPVRYISNHSSGKMGFSLANAAHSMGATVTVIAGPVNLTLPTAINRIDVKSAMDMHQAALASLASTDIFIACAAVADYRTEHIHTEKMKKQTDTDSITLTLVKNPDIIADVASAADRPFCVGFAAETSDVEAYAKGKLERKNLDLIAANDVSVGTQGFNSDNNALTVFAKNKRFDIGLTSKKEVAKQLLTIIAKEYQQRS
ncbi:bifunctional phosphopantothenoylcysteine decarboxylase/phosphopantothenate--cysteine ligase CoaBC [Psychromonas sp. 14N.309.X.WAT.B.A12]|uniref:bifunctional phosphopantothenoylcysteine decarboxylase/phosphopantothenate--cysteine ligase CoaBC n=1 Tax=Psychromonas sp. 14N.309.X.WAT.B.A12 TaxID=2998322 RepID=UPI0025B179D9|nr:bifunctional phosphopantothenoylcysteine decarboxylase/phosphopantothenate--cysteine ligase CoaBC [Psychromonas sp. 14N.309.X.WAT.B.A12]MDN2664919.1 bifunctional phosphopantothenoylcysteine decarboxylase/phosphopantothenate--cysteine ligase CoaBC [Psychromonas sp. 14N.309.X.WAT.B.A12]